MDFIKYTLSKTGWFPKWEPQITDVMDAANLVFEVHQVKGRYYYIIPSVLNRQGLLKLMRIFRSNGILLRPHHSRNFSCFVFRVPLRNQQFIRNVMLVKDNQDNFQKLLAEYNNAKQSRSHNIFKRAR
ncbi:MAG: hypothetical protein J5742_01010 [Alphaproteobacteria bacterium]|nr:hypothetical protein [Alphaproteobacteria bacterium]